MAPGSQHYQWESCDSAGGNCSPLPDANLETYRLQTADVGHVISLFVWATTLNGSLIENTAENPIGPIIDVPPVSFAPPTIEALDPITDNYYLVGNSPVAVGTDLSVGSGWTGGGVILSYTYQWFDCNESGCSAISGGADGAYTTQSSDLGYNIVAKVTAHNSGGATTAASEQTGVVGQ
jgi:hypothetical protein